jgi:UDP-glucose 4-epimerase
LRDWVEIRDAAAALAAAPALAAPAAPVLNIGSGVATPVKRIAALIQAAWQPGPNPASVQFSGFARAGDPFSLQADTRGMAAHGLRCTIAPEQGVADYVRWFQTADPAPS